MAAPRKRGLGMGLSALLGGDAADLQEGAATGQLRQLPVEALRPSPFQPRRHFAEAELESLAASLRQKGVLQPLVARPAPDGQGFELVAGERRWRAAQIAGLHELPVVVRDLADRELLEIALIENLQREELNALEEARGYRQLIHDFDYTQEALADVVGKSRSHLANMLRLLNLPDEVQDLLVTGRLTAGHARALLGTEHPFRVAREVIRRELSVRETEALVAAMARPVGRVRAPVRAPDITDLETRLAQSLGLDVQIRPKKTGGTLLIRFSEAAQLDRVIEKLISGG